MSFSIVNHATGFSGANGATFVGGNTAGNLLVCFAAAGHPLSTPTDTIGNTWVDCGAGQVTGYAYCQLWIVASCLGTSSNNLVSTSAYDTWIFEISGAASSNPVDKTSSGTGTSGTGANNCSAGSVTTTQADMVITGSVASPGTHVMNVGTNVAWATPDALGDEFLLEYFAQSSAGAITGNTTDASSGDSYMSIMVAFLPASGAAFQPDEDFGSALIVQPVDRLTQVWGLER